MIKFFNSLLFKGVGAHLLLFVFLFLENLHYNLGHIGAFLTYYFISLVVVFLVLVRPSQTTIQTSHQLDLLISGDFSKTDRPKGNNELTMLYDKVITLGENVAHTQNSLENQRNQLDSILTYMVDGVIATDRRGNIILANKSALNYLSTTEEEILNQNIIPMLQLSKQYSFYDLLEKEPEVVIDTTNTVGDSISLRVKFVLFRQESGFISGIIAVLHDTTEQEKNEREQRAFVSNVSHELRTPLTSVKAYLEALQDGAMDDLDVAQSFLEVSLNETNRMIRMISDLLTLSRIDQERLTLNKELINLVAFLNFQLDRLTRVAKANPTNNLTGEFHIRRFLPDEPVWIEMDTDKMTQVIDNIVGNALKYSPKGGEIDIRLTVQEKLLTITVSDEGMGIPQADLNKIFKRFYRVDEARNSQTGGTGLGLAIVKDIIKLHGGTVEASSAGVGLGTTFTIVLPYTPDLLELDDEEAWDEAEEE